MTPTVSQQTAFRYIREKVDELLAVMGTLPLRPEELDDDMLISLDPIGIIAESFRQVLEHLNETNQKLSLATAEIRGILDTLGGAVVVLDLDDHIEDCNRKALDWFFGGAERARIIGHRPGDVCEYATGLERIRTVADGTIHTANMFGRDMQIVATRVLDAAGRPAKTVMLFSDITQQKEGERRLLLFSEVFRQIGEGILITDADNHIVQVNDAVERITGHTREELIGREPGSLKSGLHEPSFYAGLWRTLRSNGYWQGEMLDQKQDGTVIPLLMSISEVRDVAGVLTHHIAVMSDISSLKETQSRLDFLAHHDALTELPNRLLLNDRLSHAIDRARRDDHPLAVLFIDLDRFKNVNDTLGHEAGDRVLIESAHRLRTMVRRSDTLARLGGDEFVVLMESGASQASASLLADKIVAAFRQPFSVGGIDLHIGSSIGIALYPDDGEDAGTLLKNADTAMYRAKAAGRESHARYSAALSEAMSQKMELDHALRMAVRNEEFELHYQPIVDTVSGRVIASEALIRWPKGPASARSPDKFIRVAEETRLILPLGDWILHTALTSQRRWHDAGLGLDYVSVNISAVQLARSDFADRVLAALDATGLPGPALQIELTENVLMGDMELCARVLSRLRESGIRIAIDDFGTGYSSLAYLKQLPIDSLKLDRSFVRDVPGDPNDCAIATAVIVLAKTLGLDAVAEGIETLEQQAYLCGVGCEKVQGYLHARPMPAVEFEVFVRSR